MAGAKRGSPVQLGSDPQWTSPADYENQQPYATADEAQGAATSLAWEDTAVGLLSRAVAVHGAEQQGATKLSPEEANSRYPGMPTPFREHVSPYVAQMLFDREQEQQNLARKVQNGPQDAWNKTKYFGAGIVAHMMDPIEFGVGAVSGWAVGGAMARTAWGARTAALAETSFKARTALNMVEAVAGNTIENTLQEAATLGVQQEMEGIKYDPVQGMQNIAVGTFFGSVLGMGIKEGSFRLSRFLKNTSPEADLAIVRSTVGQYEEGIRPDTQPLLKALAQETNISPKDFPGKFDYGYEKLTKETAAGRKFYVSSNAADGFNPDSVRLVGEEHGIGVQMTDNPGVANAASARAFSDARGVVYEVEAKDLNPLDLNGQVPENLMPAFKKALEGLVDDSDEKLFARPGRDLMEALYAAVDDGDAEPARIMALQQELQEQGFNSFVQDGTKVGGFDHGPHNVVTVFDQNLLKENGFYDADPGVRGDPNSNTIRGTLDDRESTARKLHIDDAEYRQTQADLAEESLIPEKTADDAEFFDQFDAMKEQGLLEPELAKELDNLRELDANHELENKMLKAVLGCVNG